MSNKTHIEFDKAKAKRLLKEYEVAVDKKEPVFTFEGVELVTKFAYYLLQHISTQFAIDPNKIIKPI